MKNRESLKTKLQNTDDETLKKMICALAVASGISEERKNAMIADIPRIRRLLTETDDGELTALISAMGMKSASDALKKLNSENK